MLSVLTSGRHPSALSLRVFGDDLTVAGRQAGLGKKGKSKSNEDAARGTPTPVPDGAVPETEAGGAEGMPD
jgi:hypothetical protein